MAFFGYSGCDHFSVLPLLLETSSLMWVYWFEHGEGDAFDSTDQSPLVFRHLREQTLATQAAASADVAMADLLSTRQHAVIATPRWIR
jgi:hypothetical protein